MCSQVCNLKEVSTIFSGRSGKVYDDNPNTTQTLEYTKDKYNAKIRKQRVSHKVPQQPTKAKG
jgi:hypothetical protein